jgi:hypothetical protein
MKSVHDAMKVIPDLPAAKVPFWEDGKTLVTTVIEPYFITRGITDFLQYIKNGLQLPLQQLDPLTCSERVLGLIAWQRDIVRFEHEPLALYRKRVAFAFINAKDAGEVAGFKGIFTRLGIGWVQIHERQDAVAWDVIDIELSDSDLANNADLMMAIIHHYGRTCRRYRFQVTYPVVGNWRGGEWGCSTQTYIATDVICTVIIPTRTAIECEQSIFSARLRN